MSLRTKAKDDELLTWTIVGGFFTAGLLGVDIGYSSVNEMGNVAEIAIWVAHGVLALLWVVTIVKWRDPNYDKAREFVVYLCVALLLVIGIHHATSSEDEQVIEDSSKSSYAPRLDYNDNVFAMNMAMQYNSGFVALAGTSYDYPLGEDVGFVLDGPARVYIDGRYVGVWETR